MASEYWTATAFGIMQMQPEEVQELDSYVSIPCEPEITPEQEEEARWNQHQFGLCTMCKVGLDDRADFTFFYTSHGDEDGCIVCFDCEDKLMALHNNQMYSGF